MRTGLIITAMLLFAFAFSPRVFSTETVHLDPEFGKVPLSFVLNEGQFDPLMKFVAEGTADSVYELAYQKAYNPPVTRFVVDLPSSPMAKPVLEKAAAKQLSFDLYLVSPNLDPLVTGEDPYSWKSNYFFGNDPAKWKTDLPNYRRVLVHDLYPGIDLRYIARERGITHEIVIRAGANPAPLKFQHRYYPAWFEITGDGQLLRREYLELVTLESIMPAPPAYQVINGKEVPVSLKYKMLDAQNKLIGFEFGEYDPKYDIIIQPEVVFAPYIGARFIKGTNGLDMVVDKQENVYVMGQAEYTNYAESSTGFFIYKLTPGGKELGYVSYISGVDSGREIAIDFSGNVYMTGRTSLEDYQNFPFTAGAFDTTVQGWKCFVLKLNSDGNKIEYSTTLGKDNRYQPYAIAVDARGCAYITGEAGIGSITTPGAYDTTLGGIKDAFITKFSSDGKSLEYSTLIGGSGGDYGCEIAVDTSGCAYVGGYTGSTDFPTTKGSFDETQNGKYDTFIIKMNRDGSGLIYSTLIGGSNDDECRAITIDEVGNAYISGRTDSKDFPVTQGVYDQSYNAGTSDIFVAKLNEYGNSLKFSTYIGGKSSEYPSDISIDAHHNVFITGSTLSIDYPVVFSSKGYALITGLSESGKELICSGAINSSSTLAIASFGLADMYVLSSSMFGSQPIPIVSGQIFDRGCYVLKYTRENITNAVSELEINKKEFSFSTNPNPFNASVTISYTLPSDGMVTINMYSILGQKVSTLLSKKQEPGFHSIVWNAQDLASGVYLCRFSFNDVTYTRKVTMIR